MEAPLSPRAAAPAEDDEWDAALMAGVRADDGDVEGLMLGADGGGFELPQLEADSPGTDGMGWEPSPLGGAEAPVVHWIGDRHRRLVLLGDPSECQHPSRPCSWGTLRRARRRFQFWIKRLCRCSHWTGSGEH